MLDVLNERIVARGRHARSPSTATAARASAAPARCSIDGIPHGPRQVTSCQIFMRDFPDGAEITIEPFRNTRLPGAPRPRRRPQRRSTGSSRPAATSRVDAGPKPEPNTNPVHPEVAGARDGRGDLHRLRRLRRRLPERLGDALHRRQGRPTCNSLPQGEPERYDRARDMVAPARRRGLRRLHQPRRVPGRLPAGDLDQGDRRAQPRVPRLDAPQAAARARARRTLSSSRRSASTRRARAPTSRKVCWRTQRPSLESPNKALLNVELDTARAADERRLDPSRRGRATRIDDLQRPVDDRVGDLLEAGEVFADGGVPPLDPSGPGVEQRPRRRSASSA